MKVRVEKDGPVTTVIIARPEVRNCVDRETADALREAWREFDADPDQKVGVFTGEGGAFCAGFDLKTVAENAGAEPDSRPGNDGPMGPSRMLLSKPVIAAVAGPAVAGGLELSLWCDMRVAEEDAYFGVYCRRWGVPLVDGGTVRLPRLIGLSRAMDMILTGRRVNADEALTMGLVNRVVPTGRSREAAEALAHDLLRFPQTCMCSDRMSAYEQYDFSLEDALANEAARGMGALEKEAIEGARRFAGGKGRGGDFSDI